MSKTAQVIAECRKITEHNADWNLQQRLQLKSFPQNQNLNQNQNAVK